MFFSRKAKQARQAAQTGNASPVSAAVNDKPEQYRTPGGDVYVPFINLVKSRHLLIAGTTGSGKSVVINGIITSLLMTAGPDTVQFVLIDPKRVELRKFSNVPHCVRYARTMEEIESALRDCVTEMERRFSIMDMDGLTEYKGSRLYIIIDEFADLMTTGKKQCEPLLKRLAMLSRAANICCIFASQTLLSKVIDTEIKVCFPYVLGLLTMDGRQSRYIVGCPGCESLPDPLTEHRASGLYRNGNKVDRLNIYKYPDTVIENIVSHWTTDRCKV